VQNTLASFTLTLDAAVAGQISEAEAGIADAARLGS
jgi:hypothetical protein